MPKVKWFNAKHVFSDTIIPIGKCGIRFLDWRCYVRPAKHLGERRIFANDLEGPGIYGLCFRENLDNLNWKLIYIGHYLGKRTGKKPGINPFGKNVARDRWWTHIASVTMRGHRISIDPTVLSNFIATHFPGKKSFILDLMIGPLHNQKSCLSVKNGCVTSEKRLAFAFKYKALFLTTNPANILDHFCFFYVRCDVAPFVPISGKRDKKIRAEIKKTETDLIKILRPECNDGVNDPGNYDCESASKIVEKKLIEFEAGEYELSDIRVKTQ
jgi:hypothetical protein